MLFLMDSLLSLSAVMIRLGIEKIDIIFYTKFSRIESKRRYQEDSEERFYGKMENCIMTNTSFTCTEQSLDLEYYNHWPLLLLVDDKFEEKKC